MKTPNKINAWRKSILIDYLEVKTGFIACIMKRRIIIRRRLLTSGYFSERFEAWT
jgi:hypothetical protein